MAQVKRDFKGVWIPKEIWLDKELSLQEKVMLIEIDSLDNEEGCFASNNYFAEFFNLSKTRISQIIKGLQEKGFITIDYIYKGKEVEKRIIHIGGIKFSKYLGGKFSKEGGKFSKCNNITSNNINIISNNISNNGNIKETNNLTSSKTPKKLTKKQMQLQVQKENEEKLQVIVENFKNKYGEEFAGLLNDYVDVRKQKTLTPAQLTIIIDDLEKECGSDKSYMVNCIRKATAGGWSQIVYNDRPKSNGAKFVDNTTGHFTRQPTY